MMPVIFLLLLNQQNTTGTPSSNNLVAFEDSSIMAFEDGSAMEWEG